MSRRGRATAFAALAVVCGIASAGIASAYRDRVDEQLGETRPVLMLTRPLAAGSALRGRILDRLEVREVSHDFERAPFTGDRPRQRLFARQARDAALQKFAAIEIGVNHLVFAHPSWPQKVNRCRP